MFDPVLEEWRCLNRALHTTSARSALFVVGDYADKSVDIGPVGLRRDLDCEGIGARGV